MLQTGTVCDAFSEPPPPARLIFADWEGPYNGDVRRMVTRQGGGDVRSHGAGKRETPRGFTLPCAALAFANWEGLCDGVRRGMGAQQGNGDVRPGPVQQPSLHANPQPGVGPNTLSCVAEDAIF